MNTQELIKQFSKEATGIGYWQAMTGKRYAKRTLVAFNTDWNAFVCYCQSIHASPLPAKVQTVERFIDNMATTRKLASLKRYIITIRLVHRTLALTDPCSHTQIRLLMQRYHEEKQDDNKQAEGLHADHISRLLLAFESSPNIKDIRDLAIWTVAFDGLLKRSELSDICIEDVQIHDDGLISIQLENKLLRLTEPTSTALNRWLTEGLITEGYVFRRIDRHGNIGDKPLDHSSIYRVFRRAGDELGVSSKVIFSGQSPRVGAAQDLANDGATLNEIQSYGRWKSPAMPAQYIGQNSKRDKEMEKFKKETPWDND
ncbi:tyrosine-type recombinase/integrase [Photobacterium kagoshimensis]|uniref:tyrosine-type recombinase/integrase n=1 Tax=Photobacterium kagoshimensis TaxID=2910242 RepID=UPI003D0A444F